MTPPDLAALVRGLKADEINFLNRVAQEPS